VLCVLCCFILLCHGTFSVLLYSVSVLLYYSVLLCCSLLFILQCSSSCYVCVFDCIYCTLTLPQGVNPIAVNIYLRIYLKRFKVSAAILLRIQVLWDMTLVAELVFPDVSKKCSVFETSGVAHRHSITSLNTRILVKIYLKNAFGIVR
jgi:hypothetical protein